MGRAAESTERARRRALTRLRGSLPQFCGRMAWALARDRETTRLRRHESRALHGHENVESLTPRAQKGFALLLERIRAKGLCRRFSSVIKILLD